jgi:hypothetical protein
LRLPESKLWKWHQIIKAIMSKRSNFGGSTIPNFRLCYRVIAIKIACTGLTADTKTNGT